MKTWAIPVGLIVLVLAGGFIVWMVEGAPTQSANIGYSNGPYSGEALQGVPQNHGVSTTPPPEPAATTTWVAFNTPFLLSVGQGRYVGENAASDILVTLRSVEQSDDAAIIVVSYCPAAGCGYSPEPSTFALSLNSPQTFSGYTYTLTAVTETTAIIVVNSAN